ncbi:MAG TPA: M23 family metallopeptidase [Bacteroidales bacterium]|nr:M23 family metallopeptidase [Bacteroidales bacterium]
MPEEKKEKQTFLDKLRHKYRMVLLNDSTFQEVGYIRLNRLNVIAVAGAILILFVAIFWTVTAYTPVREMIPGYPDAVMRAKIIQNKIRLDSLEQELKYRDQYFANLNSIISGERPKDFLNTMDSGVQTNNIKFKRSPADSLLRHDIALSEKLTIPASSGEASIQLDKLHFFTPVRGMVTNSFNPSNNHFGTDVVAGPNEVVKASLDGTVIMATWTLETGYVIEIQHDDNLISVYKHNAELLQKVGMRVKAGDAIAIIGNSGELTTGPHLHFELWQNGMALDPENFIVF